MSIPKNFSTVVTAITGQGITNPYSQAAVLAIVAKESGFEPRSEASYKGTSNERIRSIFSKTRSLSDVTLTALKSNDKDFFDFVYGNMYGNSSAEGYKFRGRGFNQLTFKGNYEVYGKLIGKDLVKNPDLVNQPDVAAKILAAYFIRSFKTSANTVKSRYGAANINDFKDGETALEAFYNANAGFGKDTRGTASVGMQQAKQVYPAMLALVNGTAKGVAGLGLLSIVLILTIFFINRSSATI